MVVAVAVELLVALARLARWGRRETRLFTAALLTIGVAYALTIPWLGDRRLDRWLSQAAGENVSDIGHTVLVAVGCGLLSLVCVGGLAVDDNGGESNWYRPARWVVISLTALIVLAVLVLSWIGDVSRVPVGDVLALSDGGSRGVSVMFLVSVAATAVALISVFMVAVQGSGPRRMVAFSALAVVGVLGLVYVALIGGGLILDPAGVVDLHRVVEPWAAGSALVALAVAGVWSSWTYRPGWWPWGRERLPHKRPTVQQ
ncbi:hypothetical protein [Nocardia ignorata]|uniref:hypothetical protein n=1 Tax=Nocardia ignorata TaxID=145285 RepID=UPI000836E78A|nr:hypothetical protein [Nocardia ignorata]